MRKTILVATMLLVGAIMLLPVGGRADTGTGSLSGIVTNTLGTVISGAVVTVSGPASASTTTDANGAFQFSALPAGTYHVSVSKTGYADASRADVLIAGPNTAISVMLVSVDVRQLGRILVLAKSSTINTTPAAVFQVTAQTFQDQGQIQLRPILEQIPGVSVEIRNGDAFNNGGAIMALGNDTLITIRGAFSYETATLVDGHALFGGLDNIGFNSAMLNSIGLQRIDTVKGPGASSPTISDAIGGSLNYITLDPTGRPQGSISEGTDGYGGSVFNFNYTGTTPNGKIGYAFAHGAQATPGGLNHHTNFFQSLGNVNGLPQTFCFTGNTGPSCSIFTTPTDPGISSFGSPISTYGFNLVFCCDTEATLGTQFNDFGKLRYHFSPATSFAFTHMSSTTNNDFGGFQGIQFGGGFAAYPGYNGPGIGLVDEAQPGEFTGSQQFQVMNEYDVQTAAVHGNLRLSYATFYQFSYYFEQANSKPPTYLAYGAVPTGNPSKPFIFANGMPVTLNSLNDYTINGYTALRDYLVEYDLPIKSSLFTVSYDRTAYTPDVGQRCCGPGFFFDNYTAIYDHHMKGITDQLLLRATFEARRNLTATTSLYVNRYNAHTANMSVTAAFSGSADGSCSAFNTPPCYGLNGGNLSNPFAQAYLNSFGDHYKYYDAPRVGLAWRPTPDVSWRFAVGGAIAPLNLEYANIFGSLPTPNNPSNPQYYSIVSRDPKLHPETAFGYDLGMDRQLPGRDLLFSGDVYFTNLFGLFNTVTRPEGTFAGKPLVNTIYTNIASSRYEGVELAVRKSPALGFNWQLNGALMRAYAYNLPPHFYDTPTFDSMGNETWIPFTSNLSVIPGKNFNDGYFNGGPGDGSESSPYSEGYAEVSYRTPQSGLLLFGANYYGPNNDYFRKAFFVLTASARREIFPHWTVEASAFNLGNLYNGLLQASFFQTKDGNGVPVALANKTLGLAPGGVVGPRTLKLTLTRTF
jgi:hypothetical protein